MSGIQCIKCGSVHVGCHAPGCGAIADELRGQVEALRDGAEVARAAELTALRVSMSYTKLQQLKDQVAELERERGEVNDALAKELDRTAKAEAELKGLAKDYADMDRRAVEHRERAEKAERERDEARAELLPLRAEREFVKSQPESKTSLLAELDAAHAEAAMLREVLQALLPSSDKASPNVVERHLTMGRYFLHVAGAYVAMEGTQCFDGEHGDMDVERVRRWSGADFARIEEKFAAPIRTALAASPGDWLAARDRALAERVREACARVVDQWFASVPAPNSSPLDLVRTIDLDALVGGKS